MALATTNLSMLNIQNEFGGSTPISLSEYYKGGGLVSPDAVDPYTIPTGSAGTTISIGDFRGAEQYIAPTTYTYTLTSSTQGEWDMRAAAIADGWDGSLQLFVIIDSGVYVWSDNTSTPAMLIAGSFPNGLTVTVNGFIIGKGGESAVRAGVYTQLGQAGGPAIECNSNCSINIGSSGWIGGGGGSGGGSYGGGGAGGGNGNIAFSVTADGGAIGQEGDDNAGVTGSGGGAGGAGGGQIAGTSANYVTQNQYNSGNYITQGAAGGRKIGTGATGGNAAAFTTHGANGGDGGANGSAGDDSGPDGSQSGMCFVQDAGFAVNGSGGGVGWGADGGDGYYRQNFGVAGVRKAGGSGGAAKIGTGSVTWSGSTSHILGAT